MQYQFWLLVVVFLEGYAVLSAEILAIRQLVPFVGNGLESISIVISAVLIPLSFGYYAGGNYKGNIRCKLISNFVQANILLICGLSYHLLEIYFSLFSAFGINNHILQTFIFAIIFLMYPVFLLAQTIPLLSNYFRKNKLAKTTGKILFISTLGSFSGSIFSTLLFMPFIGVNNTVIVTISFVACAVLIMEKSIFSYNTYLAVFSVVVCIFLSNVESNIVEDNAYSTIQIINESDGKILSINRSSSAKVTTKPEDRFEYLKFIEGRFLSTLPPNEEPYEILIIGAGGFTFGLDDTCNNYTYVDIDSSLQEVAEKHFLPNPLTTNKKFIAKPARAFVKNHDKKYDLIFLDVYTHYSSIPFQLITEEFFYSLKLLLNDHGILLFNAIASPNFADEFSIKLDNTIHKNFASCNREVIGNYSGWKNTKTSNVIYSCFGTNNTKTYADNNNSYFLDQAS